MASAGSWVGVDVGSGVGVEVGVGLGVAVGIGVTVGSGVGVGVGVVEHAAKRPIVISTPLHTGLKNDNLFIGL